MERIMKHTITNAEWYVMELLWEEAPLSGRQIADILQERIGWSRSTSLTILRRMHTKGLVSGQDSKLGCVYSPCLPKESATLEETKDFLNRVYHGSVSMMLSALTEQQSLSKEEIDQLYAILKNAKEVEYHD